MAYPALRPTSRDFDPGSYPVKSFRAQSGAEVRILYGSRRTDQALTLAYDNIPDSDAQQFVTHFDEVFGTFSTFALPDKRPKRLERSSSHIGRSNWRCMALRCGPYDYKCASWPKLSARQP
jgi:hypothetical protein